MGDNTAREQGYLKSIGDVSKKSIDKKINQS